MRFARYTDSWQTQVNELADEIFGAGYFVQPSTLGDHPDVSIYICYERKRLLGFAKGRLLPPDGLRTHMGTALDHMPNDIAEANVSGSLGVIETVAVTPLQRHKGIGRKLLMALHDDLVGKGANKLVITFRRGPGSTDVDDLMAKMGFELWAKLPSFWRERCLAGEFQCVERRNGCSCEALIFRKAVF